jgi:hypothetical protein
MPRNDKEGYDCQPFLSSLPALFVVTASPFQLSLRPFSLSLRALFVVTASPFQLSLRPFSTAIASEAWQSRKSKTQKSKDKMTEQSLKCSARL